MERIINVTNRKNLIHVFCSHIAYVEKVQIGNAEGIYKSRIVLDCGDNILCNETPEEVLEKVTHANS